MSQTVPLILEEGGVAGKDYEDEDGIENDFAYRNNVQNATKAIRLAFIRKVYGLLSVQLFLTFVVSAACYFTPPMKEFIQTNQWMMMVAFISSIGLLFALFVKRREYPTNLILLAAFTVVQAYSVGVITSFYSQSVVLQALILTIVVLASLTLYTFQSKRDFSSMHSGLFAGLCILIVGGIIQIFVRSSVLELVISLAGALIFCLFIIYDTHLMMEVLSPEEYILATINLYMDIINLFLHLLRLLQAVNRQ